MEQIAKSVISFFLTVGIVLGILCVASLLIAIWIWVFNADVNVWYFRFAVASFFSAVVAFILAACVIWIFENRL